MDELIAYVLSLAKAKLYVSNLQATTRMLWRLLETDIFPLRQTGDNNSTRTAIVPKSSPYIYGALEKIAGSETFSLSCSSQTLSPGAPTPPHKNLDRHGILTKLGFATLTCNSSLAIYRSRDDPSSVAFVAGAYGAIALLFHFLRRFERGEGDRGRTKDAVWLLTTLLSAMFASRVAPLMPPAVGVLVYLMAAGTAAAWVLGVFSEPLNRRFPRLKQSNGSQHPIIDASPLRRARQQAGYTGAE